MNIGLTDRQQRELSYHADHAAAYRRHYDAIDYSLVTQTDRRRWWNQAWAMYTEVLKQDVAGKRVLVVGCGFGDDCFQLARVGARVYGFDLSPELLEVGRQVAAREGLEIDFRQLPAEQLDYPDGFFDAILVRDILHHVEIPQAMSELVRVSRPGAVAVINEVYTHSLIDRIRYSWFVREVLYKRMVRIVYGADKPYITEDERKMNEHDIALVLRGLEPRPRTRFFDMAVNRVLPAHTRALNILDHVVLNFAMRPVAHYLGGRILMTATIVK
jgi:ubiquinone/menaquinone biosynthesis C-methylase UbiE